MSTLIPAYETTFITRTELTDDQIKNLKDRIASIAKSFGGEVFLTEDWGKRKLAYPMQKETRGHYTFMMYTGKGEIVKEVERNLRISEHVLRFLTVTLGKEVDLTKYKTGTYNTFMMEKHDPEAPREGGFRGDRGGFRGDRSDRGDRGDRGFRSDRGDRE